MLPVYMTAAIVLLTLGHVFKAKRWQLFLSAYEEVPPERLISSLSAGYLINFFIPFHLGDVFRVWYAGRRMQNGYGYSTATVIVDRCLDVLLVSGIFGVMHLCAPTERSGQLLLGYVVLLSVLAVLFLLAVLCNRGCKQLALSFCSVFNEGIKFRLLFFLWSLISSFKDLFRKIRLWKLILHTLLMWGSYLCSYWCLSMSLEQLGFESGLVDCFAMFFGGEGLFGSTFLTTYGIFNTAAELMLCGYILLPLPILLLYSLGCSLHRRRKAPAEHTKSRLLPQRSPEEQLQFLHAYFEGSQRQALHEYLNMNSDVTILRDHSSGSDATTMLCLREDETLFRKYAFGYAAVKLQDQAQWLKDLQGKLPLPEICLEKAGEGSYCYDMRYPKPGIGLFQYIYCHPTEESWSILHRVLEDLREGLYPRQGETVTPEAVTDYIESKVTANLRTIRQSRVLRPLMDTEYLTVNGVSYRNLSALEQMLSGEHLREVFSEDTLSEVHGDLTLENIICYTQSGTDTPYYLIDPNPANPIKSPAIDYAKLLQSLHGKYEFLETCQPRSITEGSIDFLLPDSPQFRRVYGLFHSWLKEQFTSRQLRSIYYHEIVHWLRLLPYRLRRNEGTAPCYYAAMILVMNDIFEQFEEGKV